MIPKQATKNHPANTSIKTPVTIRRSWACERCGAQLPKSGRWHHRFIRYQANASRQTSGYNCDDCTLAVNIQAEPDTQASDVMIQ
jgi:hypothetical protein